MDESGRKEERAPPESVEARIWDLARSFADDSGALAVLAHEEMVRGHRARAAAIGAAWRAREDAWGGVLERSGSGAAMGLAFCALLCGRLVCLALRGVCALPALAAALAAAGWATLRMRARLWLAGGPPLFSFGGRLGETIDAWDGPFRGVCRAVGLHKAERAVDALRAAVGLALRADPGLAPQGRFWRALGLCPYRLAATELGYGREREMLASGQARRLVAGRALLLAPELAIHAREPMGLLGFLECDGAPWTASAEAIAHHVRLGFGDEAAAGAAWLAWVDALREAKLLGAVAAAKGRSAAGSRPGRRL